MRTEKLHLVKNEVERKFGRKIITASDCMLLSDDVFIKTGVRLNSNTLRRCYGLIKTTYPPSNNTLNVLSEYAGFSSFDNLVCEVEKHTVSQAADDQSGLLAYLVSLFKSTYVPNKADATSIRLVRHTIDFLNNEESLIMPFQKAIARTASGQALYFEHHANMDKLHAYYGDGLYYYLQEKKTPDAQIFGHALLCLRYWLAMDAEKLNAHYSKMMALCIDTQMNPFITARYFAAQLLWAEVEGYPVADVLASARSFYQTLPADFPLYTTMPCFELIMAEALVLVHQYEEALYYIQAAAGKNGSGKPQNIDPQLFYALHIYKAMALLKTGRYDKAAAIYSGIKKESFYFLSRQFHDVFYLMLSSGLKKTKSIETQLAHLVAETGYTRLAVYSKQFLFFGSKKRVA